MDGAAMSIYNIIAVAMVGIMTGVFNWMLAKAGYIAPIAVNSISEASSKLAANGWLPQVADMPAKAAETLFAEKKLHGRNSRRYFYQKIIKKI